MSVIEMFHQSSRHWHKIQYMMCNAWNASLVFFLCLSATCLSQTVTIRVVDLTNGRPVSNIGIYVSGLRGNGVDADERRKLLSKPVNAEVRVKTDTNGEAGFSLVKPVPDHFYVRADLSGSHWDCTCTVRIATEKAVQEGLTFRSPYADRKRERLPSPKPGEIIFGVRPMPLWVRALWPIMKG